MDTVVQKGGGQQQFAVTALGSHEALHVAPHARQMGEIVGTIKCVRQTGQQGVGQRLMGREKGRGHGRSMMFGRAPVNEALSGRPVYSGVWPPVAA
ncbi:hypothetical protein GCM10010082_14860 [Kushneria pakistanensis]|uniref:Uncharacterized protein n=1 Tax=Kushneria pakistanensis TaxID=1508770 RepID=A0ABQ3FGK3_9GAMM|nr:hypothetical protein GCM10010082_14860 [Kushneria pakistanensis]